MLMKTKLSKLDTYLQLSKAELMRIARADFDVKGALFSDPLSNPKVAKNAKVENVLTFPLHLASSTLSGFNTCAFASPGCAEACLMSAGNPVYIPAKYAARIAKTRMFFLNRALFMAILIKESGAAQKKAIKLGMALAFRLNATSDILWEKYKLDHLGMRFSCAELVHMAAKTAELYDYTKAPGRVLPEFYTVTFSLSEENDIAAAVELRRGRNVAAVFDTKRNGVLPTHYTINGFTARVIDGDLSDYRPGDEQGVIVGLRAKGDAIGDTSGFVRPANPILYVAA